MENINKDYWTREKRIYTIQKQLFEDTKNPQAKGEIAIREEIIGVMNRWLKNSPQDRNKY